MSSRSARAEQSNDSHGRCQRMRHHARPWHRQAQHRQSVDGQGFAQQRLSLATHGITASGEGFEQHRCAWAKLDMAEPRHRQALTRTAEALLGWTLTREGTVARRTAWASQRRATALQSMAKAMRNRALAWSAGRCEAGPRLRSARLAGASQCFAMRWLSEDGVATAR